MAMITLSFDSYKEMIDFSKKVIEKEGKLTNAGAETAGIGQGEAQTVQAPAQSTVPAPAQQAAPVQTPASVPYGQQIAQSFPQANTAPPVQQSAPVPTTQHTYTLDELASAAMQLMDKGMQTQLQELLAGYGVEALPMLPQEQYGNFATALRGMGAQI